MIEFGKRKPSSEREGPKVENVKESPGITLLRSLVESLHNTELRECLVRIGQIRTVADETRSSTNADSVLVAPNIERIRVIIAGKHDEISDRDIEDLGAELYRASDEKN